MHPPFLSSFSPSRVCDECWKSCPILCTNLSLPPLSTTGSYTAKDTLYSPNNNQIMYCVAAVLQAEVIAGIDALNKKCPQFEAPCTLPPDMYADREEFSRNGVKLDPRTSFEFMVRFLTYIYTRVKYQPECNIVALIYVNRMTAGGELVLSPRCVCMGYMRCVGAASRCMMHACADVMFPVYALYALYAMRWLPFDRIPTPCLHTLPSSLDSNWHNVWLCAIIIAQKMWEDTAFKTSSFVSLLPGISKQALRDMEWKVLELIKFDIFIKASLYTKYYFELRQMYKELGLEGSMCDKKPLSNVKERQLEERSGKKRPVRRSDLKDMRISSNASNGASMQGNSQSTETGGTLNPHPTHAHAAAAAGDSGATVVVTPQSKELATTTKSGSSREGRHKRKNCERSPTI